MGPQLKAKHIAEDVNFHELVLKERSGRARHTFISQCKIERVHSFFKECKESQFRAVYQLPFHFKEAAQRVKAWTGVGEPE